VWNVLVETWTKKKNRFEDRATEEKPIPKVALNKWLQIPWRKFEWLALGTINKLCVKMIFYLRFHRNALDLLSICRIFPFKTTWLYCASCLLVDDTLINIRFLHILNFIYFVDKWDLIKYTWQNDNTNMVQIFCS